MSTLSHERPVYPAISYVPLPSQFFDGNYVSAPSYDDLCSQELKEEIEKLKTIIIDQPVNERPNNLSIK